MCKLGYRFRRPATRRLVLAAAADVMRPMQTATLGAGDKRAKWREIADFRNIIIVGIARLLIAE